jgi:hypothetical protein
MKHLFIILYSFLFFGTTFADEPISHLCNPLTEILGGEDFTKENIAFGKAIYAHRIEITSSDWTQYIAYYLNGYIVTDISDLDGLGYQDVNFFNMNGGWSQTSESSRSKDWRIEKFNGKRYIVHFHDGFRVYSSKDSQFVIAE